ncbi:MAG: efflux RND transporter periplasmic adaptor subunit [Chitinophagales bacterium]|nr:efflux RND transporter periplasmic adaptor subunit [Chitinophagales bacterium]
MSKKLLIILALVFLALLAIVIIGKDKFSKSSAIKVAAEEVALHNIVETVSSNGKIYPQKEVKLSLELPGEVRKIFVKEGDSVKQGQLLLEIKADNYQSSVTQANATYNQALANLSSAKARNSQAEAQFLVVQKDYNRKKDLNQQGVISNTEFEAIESQYIAAIGEKEAASQNVQASKYQVESAKANMDQTKDNLNKTQLFAPMSGIVSKLNIEEGEKVVGTAQMAGTELITISDFSKYELKIEVGEKEVLLIEKGDSVVIDVDAYLNDRFYGEVSQIAYSSTATLDQQVTKFEVSIWLNPKSYNHLINEGNNYPFRPGMSATADIITNQKLDVLSVPLQSVTLRDTSENDDLDEKIPVVFVVENNKAMLKEVKTGIQDDTNIEILGGVSKGQKVVSAPFKALSKELENESDIEVVKEEDLFEK